MNTIPIVSVSFFAIIGILAMMLLYRERKLASKGIAVAGVVSNRGHKNNTFWIDYDFSMEDGGSIKGGGIIRHL